MPDSALTCLHFILGQVNQLNVQQLKLMLYIATSILLGMPNNEICMANNANFQPLKLLHINLQPINIGNSRSFIGYAYFAGFSARSVRLIVLDYYFLSSSKWTLARLTKSFKLDSFCNSDGKLL